MHSQTHREVVKLPGAKSKEKIENQISELMLTVWQLEAAGILVTLVIKRNLMNIMNQQTKYWNCLSWRVGLANPRLKDTYIISLGHMKGYALRARVAREKCIYWAK